MWRVSTNYGYIGQFETEREAWKYIKEELNGEGEAVWVDTPNYL